MTVYNLENILISILGNKKLKELMNNNPEDRANIPKISSENYKPDIDLSGEIIEPLSTNFDFNMPIGANNQNDGTGRIGGSTSDVGELTDKELEDLFHDLENEQTDNPVNPNNPDIPDKSSENHSFGNQDHSNNPGAAHGEPHAHGRQDVSESHEEIDSNAKIPKSDMATALIRVPFGFGAYAKEKKYKKTSFEELKETGITSVAVIDLLNELDDKHNVPSDKSFVMTGDDWEFYMNFMLGLHDKVYGLSFLHWCDINEERKTIFSSKTGLSIKDTIEKSEKGFLELSGIDEDAYKKAVNNFKHDVLSNSDGQGNKQLNWDTGEVLFPSAHLSYSLEWYTGKDNTHNNLNWYIKSMSGQKVKRAKGIIKGIHKLLSGELTSNQLAKDYNLSFQKIEENQTEQETYEHVLRDTGPETFPAFASIDDLKNCIKEICGKVPSDFGDGSKTLRTRLQTTFTNFYGKYDEKENFQPGSFVLVNKAFVDLPGDRQSLFRMKRSE